MLRKFRREELQSEPERVRFKDLYPWDAIDRTPFSSSLAVIEPGGATMLHSHAPAETFFICRGRGTMTIDRETTEVSAGDVLYMKPDTPHTLRNDSESEELMFVNVFWDVPRPERPEQKPRLLFPSPPTSNGPLHVGHLAGPYLIADVLRRHHRSRGTDATFLCLTDEHQSYVLGRARADRRPVQETADRYSSSAVSTFERIGAAPDACIFPSRDPGYREAVRRGFATLLAAGFLEARDAETFFCQTCDRVLFDGLVVGTCPHCEAQANGFVCNACCLPNDTVDLVAPSCRACDRPPSIRKIKRLFFPIAPFVDRLRAHHRNAKSPKLRSLAAQMLEIDNLAPAASQVSDWGIPIEQKGFEGQVVSPWFEIAVATPYLVSRFAPGAEVDFFFGYDNAYLYLIHDPAISLALDPGASPANVAANEFLKTGGAKMSTSSPTTLGADDALDTIPVELLRWSLASSRPETSPSPWDPIESVERSKYDLVLWKSWLDHVARSVTEDAGSRSPSPVGWSRDQLDFLGQLEMFLRRAKLAYEAPSLVEVCRTIQELVHRSATFGIAQSHLSSVASLADDRATGLVLELAAVRTFAIIVAPVMPELGARLWKRLGYDRPIEWSDGVRLVPVGQPISSELSRAVDG